MKSVLEASVRTLLRLMAKMQPEPGRLREPTGWDRHGLAIALAPKRAMVSAARGRTVHLTHQGLLL